MKIIEAMKQIKDLMRKADDLEAKIAQHSAYLNLEKPVYTDQKTQVSQWLQSHHDILKEVLRLRIAIQKTNLATSVQIDIDGNVVTKTIAEWIHRRKDLAQKERGAWLKLTDRGLKEGKGKDSQGQDIKVEIVRCYEPEKRDIKINAYASEPTTIDGKLEVVNAVTDLIE